MKKELRNDLGVACGLFATLNFNSPSPRHAAATHQLVQRRDLEMSANSLTGSYRCGKTNTIESVVDTNAAIILVKNFLREARQET